MKTFFQDALRHIREDSIWILLLFSILCSFLRSPLGFVRAVWNLTPPPEPLFGGVMRIACKKLRQEI